MVHGLLRRSLHEEAFRDHDALGAIRDDAETLGLLREHAFCEALRLQDIHEGM